METASPSYMTPNLMELPKSIFIDFGSELQPLVNLMTEFYPYYSNRDYRHTVKKLISAISHQHDIDYQLADFSVEIMSEFFEPFNCASQAKLSEVQNTLMFVGRNIYNKIACMSGYVYGVFPYVFKDMSLNCELYLINTMHLNYAIEMNHKPFSFNYK